MWPRLPTVTRNISGAMVIKINKISKIKLTGHHCMSRLTFTTRGKIRVLFTA
jgi:hypothetical protein